MCCSRSRFFPAVLSQAHSFRRRHSCTGSLYRHALPTQCGSRVSGFICAYRRLHLSSNDRFCANEFRWSTYGSDDASVARQLAQTSDQSRMPSARNVWLSSRRLVRHHQLCKVKNFVDRRSFCRRLVLCLKHSSERCQANGAKPS